MLIVIKPFIFIFDELQNDLLVLQAFSGHFLR